jgi:hypothetical protein
MALLLRNTFLVLLSLPMFYVVVDPQQLGPNPPQMLRLNARRAKNQLNLFEEYNPLKARAECPLALGSRNQALNPHPPQTPTTTSPH